MKSEHQQRVEKFMVLAKQTVPFRPTMPNPEVLKLRAALILEEALETVKALGFDVFLPQGVQTVEPKLAKTYLLKMHEPNLLEIVDGCADISVVTTGTLSACGIADVRVLEIVDENNLAKFGPGHSWREDGKLIKPKDHKKADFSPCLQDPRN